MLFRKENATYDSACAMLAFHDDIYLQTKSHSAAVDVFWLSVYVDHTTSTNFVRLAERWRTCRASGFTFNDAHVSILLTTCDQLISTAVWRSAFCSRLIKLRADAFNATPLHNITKRGLKGNAGYMPFYSHERKISHGLLQGSGKCYRYAWREQVSVLIILVVYMLSCILWSTRIAEEQPVLAGRKPLIRGPLFT